MQQSSLRRGRSQQAGKQKQLPAAEAPAEGSERKRWRPPAVNSVVPEGGSLAPAERADLAQVQAQQKPGRGGEEDNAQR